MISIGRFVDYYEILRVKPDAPHEDILAAYAKEMARLAVLHLPPDEKEKRGALLNRAALILGDEQKRIAYDVYGDGGITAAEPAEARDVQPTAPSEDDQKGEISLYLLLKCFALCGIVLIVDVYIGSLKAKSGETLFFLAVFTIPWLLVFVGQTLFIRFGLFGRPLFHFQFESPFRSFITIVYIFLNIFLFAAIVFLSFLVNPIGLINFMSALQSSLKWFNGETVDHAVRVTPLLMASVLLYIYFTIVCHGGAMAHNTQYAAPSKGNQRRRVLWDWLFRKHPALYRKCMAVYGIMVIGYFLLFAWHLFFWFLSERNRDSLKAYFAFWGPSTTVSAVMWPFVFTGLVLFIRFDLLDRPLFRFQFRSPLRLFMTILRVFLSLFLFIVILLVSSCVIPFGSIYFLLPGEFMKIARGVWSADQDGTLLFLWSIATTSLWLYLYFAILCYQDQPVATGHAANDGISHNI